MKVKDLMNSTTPVFGERVPKADETALVVDPVFMMFRTPRNTLECRIHRKVGDTHEHYGMMVCDLVRHVAKAFGVAESAVWEWVDKERANPTTDIKVGAGVN